MFLLISSMVSKLGLETSLVKWIATENQDSDQASIYLKVLKVALVSSFIIGTLLFILADLEQS